MPVLPTDLAFGNGLDAKLMQMRQWLTQMFSGRQFAGDHAIEHIQLIDERLRPKAPMPRDDIEIMTRVGLSNMGLRNARLVTTESHPELHEAWRELCVRAGYGNKVPQLIITESPMANAMEVTDSEMVITTGLLKMLDLREVIGVLGHELGHGRRDHTGVRITSMVAFGGAGALVGNFLGKMGGIDPDGMHRRILPGALGRWVERHFFSPMPEHAGMRPASLLGYAALILGGVSVGRIAANQVSVKPTELQADLDGVAISGDAEALASALTKMQAADRRGPIARWWGYMKSGYPTVDERVANIRRAGKEMPANPVPAALAPAEGPLAGPLAQVREVASAERIEMPELARGNG